MSAYYQVKVLQRLCKGCELCVSICPHHSLTLSKSVNKNGFHFPEADNKPRETLGKSCSGCKQCAIICPEAAIEIFKIDEKTKKKK